MRALVPLSDSTGRSVIARLKAEGVVETEYTPYPEIRMIVWCALEDSQSLEDEA